jgi:hypothetical protein
MKTLYNLFYAAENQIDLQKVFHFNINEDVSRAFTAIKNVVIDIGLLVAGFIATVWIFGMLAGY